MKDLGLYIHIPFCEKKCYYCDFLSFTNKDHMIDQYIDYLIKEIDLYKERLEDYHIRTIFIGGGTPSLIDPRLVKKLMDHIFKKFSISSDLEATIEINPGSLTEEKARIYRAAGINRASLGLQSLNDDLLKSIGRIHGARDFFTSYDILKRAGFSNINVDMIFGLPDQTLEDVVVDLKTIIELDIKHISYYGLIIEPGTPMARWYEEGRLKLVDEDEERKIYHTIVESLKNKDYIHYEISNFAKTGYECEHNKIYWKIRPYIGLGLNSHSNLRARRYWNYSNFKDYFAALDQADLPVEDEEIIDKQMEMAEYCIFGIRYIDGINKEEFKKRFNMDLDQLYGQVIRKHIKNGLLEEDNGHIKLSKKGIDLANLVELDFLP